MDGDQKNLYNAVTANEISDLHVLHEPIEAKREVIRRREAFPDYADACKKCGLQKRISLR